jgi:hypothetical protein
MIRSKFWHDQYFYQLSGRRLEGDRKEIGRRGIGGCKERGREVDFALVRKGLNLISYCYLIAVLRSCYCVLQIRFNRIRRIHLFFRAKAEKVERGILGHGEQLLVSATTF